MAQGETCTLERRTECKNCLSYSTLYEKLYSPRGYSENTAQFHVEKEKKRFIAQLSQYYIFQL